jgi:Putative restriction endonuclease
MTQVSTRYVYYVEGEYIDEDDMAETFIQDELSNYLVDLLGWYLRFENYIVRGNINLYRKGKYKERVAPDIMVIKDVKATPNQIRKLKSYAIDPPKFPAPAVAIEIVSDYTRATDIEVAKKPTRYAELGVKEYFAFDPEEDKPVVKLSGWRYIDGLRTDIKPDKRGWLWSEELECWLASDGMYIRFYDKTGKMLLTRGDAEEFTRKEVERQAAFTRQFLEQSVEVERRQREESEQKAELAKQAREEAEQKAEVEREQREEAEQKTELARQAQEEAEQKTELARQAQEEAEQKAEAERVAREAERKQREEAEQKAEAERKQREELERTVAELRAKLGQQSKES